MTTVTPIFLYGQSTPAPKPQELCVGKISLLLEDGGLRYIRYGDQEVLRGIYSAVRDQDWGTVVPVLSNQTLQQTSDSLKLEFDALYQQNQINFQARYALEVSQTHLKFSFSGQAHSRFYRNRIGFCVLHPMSAAGARCRLEHMDGSKEEAVMPAHAIADQPVQPFAELRVLEHQVGPDLWACLKFEGETFEMEDQRNWTDASFKTFCTPLRIPFPVLIEAGTVIEQSVTLSIKGSSASTTTQTSKNILSLGTNRFKLPAIGSEIASHGEALSEKELERLRVLKLSHLRVELNLAEAFVAKLNQAVEQSKALRIPLEVALTITEPLEAKLEQLAQALEKLKPAICRFLVYPLRARTSEHSGYLRLARAALDRFSAPIFGGTNSDFYFLNGYPLRPKTVDGLTFGLHPQAHAFDNTSLVETLEAQTFIAKEAKRLSAGKPVVVSPITFKPRWNPYATSPPAPTPEGQLPSQVDPRQLSIFGAAWTLGCIKALTHRGEVEALTFYETTGWRGLMETEAGSLVPDKFPSLPGGVFPLYHVLADLAEFRGGEAVEVRSSHPMQFDGLMLRKGERSSLLITNLSGAKQRVELDGFPKPSWLRKLRDHTLMEAIGQPEHWRKSRTQPHDGAIELPPFAYVRLDFLNSPLGEGPGVRA